MFTFNNMKESDELSMTITVIGCVHYEDCFPVSKISYRYFDFVM